jgi:hypothetical protein
MRGLLFSCLFVVITASTALAGAPLKGVDVKLGKNPGGKPAARINATGPGYSLSTGTYGDSTVRVAPPVNHSATPFIKRK